MKLRYPGLNVRLLGDGSAMKFQVFEIDVTSNRWAASSIRIGALPNQVVRRFGEPISRRRRDGRIFYEYVTRGNTGSVSFEFRNGRLARILMSETLC